MIQYNDSFKNDISLGSSYSHASGYLDEHGQITLPDCSFLVCKATSLGPFSSNTAELYIQRKQMATFLCVTQTPEHCGPCIRITPACWRAIRNPSLEAASQWTPSFNTDIQTGRSKARMRYHKMWDLTSVSATLIRLYLCPKMAMFLFKIPQQNWPRRDTDSLPTNALPVGCH